MSEVNYEKLKAAFDQLEEEYVRWNTKQNEIPDESKNAVKEALIIRFRACYDLQFEYIQKTLINLGLVNVYLYPPKQVYRMAHEAHLIDVETLARLFEYSNKREKIARAEKLKHVEDALTVVENFVEDGSQIYETISQKQ